MHRFLTIILLAVVVVGCGQKAEEPAASEPVVEEANPLAAYAGEWSLQALAQDTDDVLVEVGMTASDSPDGWAMNFGHLSEPVPGNQVMAQGDSVMVTFGPYWSALQDEVMVTTSSVLRLEGDQLVGYFTATYTGGDPPVLNGRLVGTRASE